MKCFYTTFECRLLQLKCWIQELIYKYIKSRYNIIAIATICLTHTFSGLPLQNSEVSSMDTALACVREVVSSSQVSTNAFVKIECAWNSLGQGIHCWLSRRNSYKTRGADPGCDGLNRAQLPLWLKQSLINGFSWYGLKLS